MPGLSKGHPDHVSDGELRTGERSGFELGARTVIHFSHAVFLSGKGLVELQSIDKYPALDNDTVFAFI